MKNQVTTATRHLSKHGVKFKTHTYQYVERGGTKLSSFTLGVDEHKVIKTIVFTDKSKNLYVVLMHGDREVSAKKVAKVLGLKNVEPADSKLAERKTAYKFGGTSPFGMKSDLPVFVESSIMYLDKIWINGGKRGFLVELNPKEALSTIQFRTGDFSA